MPEYSGQIILADPYTGPVVGQTNAAGMLPFGQMPDSPQTQRDASLLINSAKQGIAGSIDQVLNTPNRLWNLGKAGVGTVEGLMGQPDAMPDVTPDPNFAQRAFDSLGLTHPELTPQTAGERILAATGRGAGGMAVMPASSLQGMGMNALMGGASQAAGQGTQEATGSPVAGQAAAMAVPLLAAGASAYGQNAAQQAATLQSQKQPRTDTLQAGRDAGIVIPPATSNPTLANRLMESFAGKAATQQDATLQNQPAVDALMRKDIGAPPEMALTSANLQKLSDEAAEPYRQVAALPQPVPRQVGTFSGGGAAGTDETPMFGKTPQSPADAINELKQARLDANMYWRKFNGPPIAGGADPATRELALAAQQKAGSIETYLQDVANQNGRPDLISDMAAARTRIAKINDVDRALNDALGETNAQMLARAQARGARLTGGLKTVADLGTGFSKAVGPPGQGSPGVNNLTALLSAGTGGAAGAFLGGPGGAAAGSALGAVAPQVGSYLARKLILSGPYQRTMGTPSYEPNVIGRMAGVMPSQAPQDVVLQSLMAQRLRGQQ